MDCLEKCLNDPKNIQFKIMESDKLIEVHHIELSDENYLSNILKKYQRILKIRFARNTHQRSILQKMAKSGNVPSKFFSENISKCHALATFQQNISIIFPKIDALYSGSQGKIKNISIRTNFIREVTCSIIWVAD